MLKNNIAIQYHDFHPSEPTRFFIESIVNEIHEELPGGSTVKATFTKQSGDYGEVMKGMLQVGSYNGPFFAVATADTLREVTVKLTEQMRRRLEKWKSRNTERRGLRHLRTSTPASEM